MNTTTIRVTANSSWCGIAWTNPGGRIEGRTLPELAALFARASQAERALATVTAERDEALRKRDEWAALWDGSQAKLASEREAWDREQMVLTARIESVAHDHAKAVAERDEARAKLAEAERDLMGVKRNYNVLYEMADKEGKTLRSRIAKLEAVVEAADTLIALLVQGEVLVPVVQCEVDKWRALRALDADTGGKDKKGGSHAPSPVTPGTDSGGSGAAQATANREAPLRDGGQPTGDATVAPGDAQEVTLTSPEPAGSSHDTCGLMHVKCSDCGGALPMDGFRSHTCPAPPEPDDAPEPDPQAPATRAELEELRREVLTTLADALCEVHVPMPGHEGLATVPAGLRELAEGLRARIERGPRRVERLEQLTGFAPKE